MAQTLSETPLKRNYINIYTVLQGCLFADVVLRGFLHSRMQNKAICSPTFIFLNSFSLSTFLTNNIMCKDDSSLNANPPSLAQEMPTSSTSCYSDSILKKCHYMLYPVPTFLLGICFGTARDRILGRTSRWLFLHVYVLCSPP